MPGESQLALRPCQPRDSASPRQMPIGASGKGVADAASATAPNRLTKTQLDAVLILAAAGNAKQKEEPTHRTHPVARGAAGLVHIAFWDSANEVKLTGADAPTADTLDDVLQLHPKCKVYAGQKPSGRAAVERSGLDELVDASAPSSDAHDRHHTLREQAFSQAEEPTKRSMYSSVQVQRLQVR